MTRGTKTWFCEECRHRTPLQVEQSGGTKSPWLENLDRLPNVLAIPLQEYTAETEHPVMQLHRFCDAVELLTRFCTILALGELRQQRRGQALPDGLVPSLRDHLERPTFGQWKNLL